MARLDAEELNRTHASPDAARRPGRRRWILTWLSVIVLPVFALTFAYTHDDPRAILGTVALLVIIGVFGWVVMRARRIDLTTVHLGFLAAVATSVIGGIIGVLLATEIATGRNVVTDGGADAHPATGTITLRGGARPEVIRGTEELARPSRDLRRASIRGSPARP